MMGFTAGGGGLLRREMLMKLKFPNSQGKTKVCTSTKKFLETPSCQHDTSCKLHQTRGFNSRKRSSVIYHENISFNPLNYSNYFNAI